MKIFSEMWIEGLPNVILFESLLSLITIAMVLLNFHFTMKQKSKLPSIDLGNIARKLNLLNTHSEYYDKRIKELSTQIATLIKDKK